MIRLGDRSPARLLGEGDLDEVGPEVVGAARAFLAVGMSGQFTPVLWGPAGD